MRVAVLTLALLGGSACAFLGISFKESVQELGKLIPQLLHLPHSLLVVFPLGVLAGLFGFHRKRWVAGLLLLVCAGVPLYFHWRLAVFEGVSNPNRTVVLGVAITPFLLAILCCCLVKSLPESGVNPNMPSRAAAIAWGLLLVGLSSAFSVLVFLNVVQINPAASSGNGVVDGPQPPLTEEELAQRKADLVKRVTKLREREKPILESLLKGDRVSADGMELVTWEKEEFGAHEVIFSPDAATLAVLDSDQLTLWDVQSGKLLRTLEGDDMNRFTFSPNGEEVYAFGLLKGVTRCWGVKDGAVRDLPWAVGRKLGNVAVSPDRTTLIARAKGPGNTTRWEVFDLPNGRHRETLTCLGTYEAQLVLTPDNRTLASTGFPQGDLTFTDIQRNRTIQRLNARAANMTSVFSPDGLTLATLCGKDEERALVFWDVRSGTEVRRIRGEAFTTYAPPRPFSYSPDGNLLLMQVKKFTAYDPQTGNEKPLPARLTRLTKDIYANFAFSPGGGMLATVIGRKVSIWDFDRLFNPK